MYQFHWGSLLQHLKTNKHQTAAAEEGLASSTPDDEHDHEVLPSDSQRAEDLRRQVIHTLGERMDEFEVTRLEQNLVVHGSSLVCLSCSTTARRRLLSTAGNAARNNILSHLQSGDHQKKAAGAQSRLTTFFKPMSSDSPFQPVDRVTLSFICTGFQPGINTLNFDDEKPSVGEA